MRRALRIVGRVLRWLGITIVAILLIVALVLVALTQTQPGRDFVASKVLDVLNTSVFVGELEVDALTGPVFGRVGVEGAVLRGPDGHVHARLGAIEIDYTLAALRDGRVQVDQVTIDGLDVDARILEDGSLDLAALIQPGDGTSDGGGDLPVSVDIDAITLRNSAFRLRDLRTEETVVDVADLAAEGAFSLERDASLSARVAELSSGVSLPSLVDRRWAVRLRDVGVGLATPQLTVEVAEVHLDDAELLGFDGEVTLAPDGEQPFAHVDIAFPRFALSPDELNPFLGQEVLLAPIRFGARISGPPQAVRLDVPVEGPEGRVEIGATLDLTSPVDLAYQARVRLIRVRPGAWLDLGEFDADVSAGLTVRGSGLTPQAASLDARLEVGPSRVGPFSVEEAFVAASYGNDEVRVSNAYVRARGAELTMRGAASRSGQVELDLEFDVPDVAATAADVAEMVGEDMPADVRSGSISLSVEAGGSLPLEAWADGQLPENLEAWSAALETFELSLDLDADDVDALGVVVDRADVTASASAPGSVADAQVDVDVRGLVVPGLSVPSARVVARLADDRLSLDLDTTLPGITGRTRVSASAQDTDDGVTVRLSRLELEPMDIPVALVQPTTIRLSGPWDAPERVRTDGLVLRARSAAIDVDADVRLGEGVAPGRLDVGVVIAGLDLEEWGDLLPLDAVPGLQATVGGRLGLQGTLARPELTADLDVPELRVEGLPSSSVELDLRCASGSCGGDVRLQPLRAGAPAVSATGLEAPLRISLDPFEVELAQSGAIGGDVELDDFALDLVSTWMPSLEEFALAGEVTGAVSVGGTLAAPSADIDVGWTGVGADLPLEPSAVRIDDLDGGINGTVRAEGSDTAVVDLAVRTTWRGEELIVGTVDGDLDVGALLDGSYDPRAQSVRASVGLRRIAVTDLPEGLREQVEVESGWIELGVSWNGTVDDPGGKATINVGDVVVAGIGPLRGNARVMAADRISVGAAMYRGQEPDALLSARGGLDQGLTGLIDEGLERDAEIELDVSLAALPLVTFAPLVPELAQETAVARGTVRASGRVSAPELDADVSLEELRLVGGGTGAWSIEMNYGAAATTVDVTMQADGADVVTASGRVEIARDADGVPVDVMEWPLSLELDADAAPLSGIVPALAVQDILEEVDGVLNADVSFSGSLRRPHFDGTLNVEEGAASIIPLGRSFEGVRLAARVDDTGLRIDELRLGDEDGFVTGSGDVILDGLGLDRYELSFRFRDLFVSDPSGAGVNLRGEVRVDGDVSDEEHLVDVVLDGMRVTVPDSTGTSGGPTSLPEYVYFVDEDVAASEVGERNPTRLGEDTAESEASSPTPIRIDIRTTGENVLRHPLIEVTFEVELLVEIIGADVRTDGAVTITSGGLSVASNRFDIERGIVRFGAGGDAFDPMVDVEAVHVLQPDVSERVAAVYGPPGGDSASIKVSVNGRVSDLAADPEAAIRLTSDPSMNRQDIFLVLATGRLSGDGDTSEAQEGVAALSGLLLGLVSDRLSESLFIDTLRIDASSESQRIEGGKYISDNLYVSGTYIRTPDEQEDNNFEVSLQWILRRIGPGSLRFEVRGGDQAKGGVELLYQVIRRARGEDVDDGG